MEASMRRKATLGLLAVTLAWGATFIWMKQAMDAIQPEIGAYGRTPVVAALVGGRFLIAFIALFVISKEARSALSNQQLWRGGLILGGILLIGFITQMIGLDSITPSTSAFLTSLYVVFTAVITTTLDWTKGDPNHDSRCCTRNIWSRFHRRSTTFVMGRREKFSRSSVPFSSPYISSLLRK